MPDGSADRNVLVGGVEAPRHRVGVGGLGPHPGAAQPLVGVWFVPLRVLNAPLGLVGELVGEGAAAVTSTPACCPVRSAWQ